jgi:SAM-dependent methyltransferase
VRLDTVARLGNGALSRATLAAELAASPEFAQVRALDDAVARAAHARRTGERPRHLTAPHGDERPIEIAWTLARYRHERRVLDVGYANAEPAYLAALLAAAPAPPIGVDLADGDVPGFESVRADVRELPFRGGSIDVAFCISTLEHVGQDNRVYGAGHEHDPDAIAAALAELARVLARAGRLLVTVPTGADEEHEWFVQRAPERWAAFFETAGLAVHEQELYELTPGGWHSTERLTPDLRYGERGPGASAVLCAELRARGLRHALRRRATSPSRRGA